MEQKPKLTVAGFRGIWGKDLTENVAFEFALAFAKMLKQKNPELTQKENKKILIGRDARKTGPTISTSVKQALEQEGFEVDYAGIIPTPSMLLLVRKLSYDGGVIITASHNPPEYNGLKFVMPTGLFTIQSEVNNIEENKKNLNEQEKEFVKKENNQYIESDNSKFRKIHIDEILKNIDVDLIKSKKFKIAHDPINSAGSVITKELLESLGCEVVQINAEQNGEFAHMPEPVIKNLTQLSEAVILNKTDIGFAQDPDADRLVIINEKGEILSEEYTLALAIKSVFIETPTDVVVNMSTFNVSTDIAVQNNFKVYRTKIGESHVVEKLLETKALIGGEGSGGVIYPKINPARDSLVGIALTLLLMASENKKISEITDGFPKYIIKKDKITFTGELDILYKKLKEEFKDATVNTLDGVRFDWDDFAWIHIRPSNTEPILRIFGEAKTEERINELFKRIQSIL